MSTLRLDRLLWFLRLAPSRTRAQQLVAAGHIRRNAIRTSAADCPVAVGDVLTLPRASGVLVIEILALPQRRGPKAEAREHYRVLDGSRPLRQSPRQTPGEPSTGGRGPEDSATP